MCSSDLVRSHQANLPAQVPQNEVASDDTILLQIVFADASQRMAEVLKNVKLHLDEAQKSW